MRTRAARRRGAARDARRNEAAGGCGRRRRSGVTRALAALALLLATLGAVAGTASAAAPLWLEPLPGGGVAALFEDGRVVRDAHDPARSAVLARGWQGDRLLACGGGLFGVDGGGRLVDATAGDAADPGPRVSPHADPACLAGERVAALSEDARRLLLLGDDLEVATERAVAALPDTEIVPFGGFVALLAEPTFRYRHGVLGDELEAGALLVLRQSDLAPVARWRVGERAVIEQRGALPFALGARAGEGGGAEDWGLLVTRSTPRQGAQVVALELTDDELVEIAEGAPIGSGNRWLNLFAATGGRAYSVRTPHLGGPLERYALPDTDAGRHARLPVERFDLGVTNHVLGARNLDLGILLPASGPAGADLLVLPRQDLRALRVVRCGERCRVTAELPLAGRLTSNLAAVGAAAGGAVVWAGDDSGAVQRFALDVRGERRP